MTYRIFFVLLIKYHYVYNSGHDELSFSGNNMNASYSSNLN